MTAKPLVSVIIPVHNLEIYLEQAVDSVLEQTYHDFEVILVNDGSTDGSWGIITEYCRREPEKICAAFQDHRGASAARNVAIDMARGEWIAFLDGDDVWKPTKLADQLRLATADPQCNFIACAAEILGQERLFHVIPTPPFDLKIELLRQGCYITLSTVLIRRDLLTAVRFDERLEGAQEFDLFLRLADLIRIEIIPVPLIYYRLRQDAISGMMGKRFLQVHRHFQIVCRELKRLKQENPQRIQPYFNEISSIAQRLAHEAAYYALMNPQASITTRLKLALIAIAERPGLLKNYRLFLQALLPAALNQHLVRIRHQ